ncbi:mitochondrial carrier domain-containing protein [Melampsora americana]|nr:mitochondrial carrier domain-containing protein [Melampsora americana]
MEDNSIGSIHGHRVSEYLYNHRTTASAAVASICATVTGFPLDSIKSRLQVNRYNSVLDCVKKTYAQEGTRGFYRGIAIPMLTITVVRTTSFTIYNKTKESFEKRNIFSQPTVSHKAISGFAGGAASGLMISLGSCAFELVKIRAQLESAIAEKQGRAIKNMSTWQGAMEIIRSHGVRGLYFGFSLHCLRDTIGTGLYFMGYDSMRLIAEQRLQKENQRSDVDLPPQRFILPPALIPFVCGSTCGVASWFLIYPLDLVKSRIQRDALANTHARQSALTIFKSLIKQDGFTKLYSGLSISAFRSFCQHGMMWTILESVRSQIEILTGHSD